MGILLRVIAYNLVWAACVLGAANGNTWIGPLAALVTVAAHIAASRQRIAEAKLVATLAVIGLIIDSGLMHAGILRFNGQALIVPLWFAALWPAFATLLNTALMWLRGRPMLSVLFGALGGPFAYFSGAKLGALQLNNNLTLALMVIAMEWAIVTPVAVWLAQRFETGAKGQSFESEATDVSESAAPVALEGGN